MACFQSIEIPIIKGYNPFICNDILRSNALPQHDAFKRPAAAKCNIELAVLKSAATEVDQQTVESFALAFMDGNRPSQFERILGKRADALRFQAPGWATFVADNFPFRLLHFYAAFIAKLVLSFHHNFVGFNFDNFADAAIDKFPFFQVVAHEHYLSALAQAQAKISGVQAGVKSALYSGDKFKFRGIQQGKLPLVDTFCGRIPG